MFASNWIGIVLIVYLVMMIFIGYKFSKQTKDIAGYLLAKRSLGPWVTGFSQRASEMSGWMSIGVPGEGFAFGVAAMWNLAGCYLADLFSWSYLAKRLRIYTEAVGVLTLPGFFETRYRDNKGLLRVLATLIIIGFMVPYVSAQFVAAGKLFDAVTPLTYWQGIILGAIIMITYTVLGGFFAVSWTDFFQGMVALFGISLLAIVGIFKLGFSGLFQGLENIDPVLVSPTFGLGGIAALVTILSYIAIGFGWPGNIHIMVRFMGIRSAKEIKKAALIALLLISIVYTSAVVIGLSGRVAVDTLGLQLADMEYIMPSLAALWLPLPIAGITIAAALALMMSTADSQLLVAVGGIVEDVYHRFFNREASEAQLLLLSRVFTVVLGLLALFLAQEGGRVFLLVLYAWSGLGAAFGPPIILSLWWKKTTKAGVVAGMITGTLVTILWKQFMTPIFDYWFYELLVSFPASFIVTMLVSSFTKPPETAEEEISLMQKPLDEVIGADGSRYNCMAVERGLTEMDQVKAWLKALRPQTMP